MEKLSFKITLDSEYHDFQKEPPEFRISVNSTVIEQDFCTKETTIEFDFDCDASNTLRISLLNKSIHDIILGEDGLPEKNKLLHIRNITIDDVDITTLAAMISEYYPNDEWYANSGLPNPMRTCMDLGWNGDWRIEFTTPFYVWLLSNL